jgi:hypothetical protein
MYELAPTASSNRQVAPRLFCMTAISYRWHLSVLSRVAADGSSQRCEVVFGGRFVLDSHNTRHLTLLLTDNTAIHSSSNCGLRLIDCISAVLCCSCRENRTYCLTRFDQV